MSRAEQEAATICVCLDGYTGDPDSLFNGCTPKTAAVKSEESEDGAGKTANGEQDLASRDATVDGCRGKNETYGVGQEWNDGCEYKCSCNEKVEIVCQERCKVSRYLKDRKIVWKILTPTFSNVQVFSEEAPSDCELRPDPTDDCCQVMFCPDPNAPAVDEDGINRPLKPIEQVTLDGCTFKNATYAQGERFYDGCEQQCQCMGYGDMVCLSRCPPTAPVSPGQNCYTLPDASDPCCNITVCDKPTLDPDQNVRKKEEDEEVTQVKKEGDTEAAAATGEIAMEPGRTKEPRIVTEPFGKPIPGKDEYNRHL